MTFIEVLLVGMGGFFGAVARYKMSQLNKKFFFHIPIGTLIINLAGSFLLGVILSTGLNHFSILLLGTGFMGAFTTFSTFNLEGVQLIMNKKKKEFILYNLISYGAGILLAFIGMEIGRYFL
ncbi:fluoride efflux transporter CrcB [Bacillus sp. M6-12]|uniref:fluoride efflux transporter CrcB n=1 Tax=Bacillus sp. M6-12 TaxID=2054166 RepID=UPI000C77056F|nr:fluoride efflux transporter CrcB [Bacillus sp. M6-12]PLS14751.1 fluoride efflux transporter CrcB [Bacillus sp. M6-12]